MKKHPLIFILIFILIFTGLVLTSCKPKEVEPPVAELSNLPDNITNDKTINIEVGGEEVIAYKYNINNSGWSDERDINQAISHNNLPDGSHTVSVIGRDEAGNWQSEATPTSHSWTVDTTPPSVLFNNLPQNPTNEDFINVSVMGSGVVEYKYKIDDGNWSGERDINLSIQESYITEGLHTLYAIGKDEAGNWQSEATPTSHSWTMDTTPPSNPIVNGESSPSSNPRPTWTWNSVTDAVIYRYSFTDGSNWTDTTDTSYTPTYDLTQDTYTLYVQACDEAGNWSGSGNHTVTLTLPPYIVSVTPASNEENVFTDSNIVVTFSEGMNTASAESAFSFTQSGSDVPGSFSWSSGDSIMTFTPNATLSYLTDYDLSISDTALDLDGLTITQGYTGQFTTCDGAFLVLNSWGLGWGGDHNSDGKYWITFEAAKQVDLWARMFQSDLNTVKAVIRIQLEHDIRSNMEIKVGIGNTIFPYKTKQFLDTTMSWGDHPFPDEEIIIDISEFYNDFITRQVFVKVKDKSGDGTGKIKGMRFRIWETSSYLDDSTWGDHNYWYDLTTPYEMSDGETKTYTFTSHQNDLSMRSVETTDDNNDFISKASVRKFTIDDIDMLKSRWGAYQEGKDYNPIFQGKYGTGLVPPTEGEYEQMLGRSNYLVDYTHSDNRSRLNSIDRTTEIYFPPVGNQGSKGSCSSFANGYYIQTYYSAKNYNHDLSGASWVGSWPGHPDTAYQDKIISPEFLYNILDGGDAGGTYQSDNCYVIYSLGVATWATMPYTDHGSPPFPWPDTASWEEAPKFRGRGDLVEDGNNDPYHWKRMYSDSDLDVILSLLEDGYLVSTSVDAGYYSSLTSNDVWLPSGLPTNPNDFNLNHANTIVGFKRNFDPTNPSR
jgi:hypothetical protein